MEFNKKNMIAYLNLVKRRRDNTKEWLDEHGKDGFDCDIFNAGRVDAYNETIRSIESMIRGVCCCKCGKMVDDENFYKHLRHEHHCVECGNISLPLGKFSCDEKLIKNTDGN